MQRKKPEDWLAQVQLEQEQEHHSGGGADDALDSAEQLLTDVDVEFRLLTQIEKPSASGSGGGAQKGEDKGGAGSALSLSAAKARVPVRRTAQTHHILTVFVLCDC